MKNLANAALGNVTRVGAQTRAHAAHLTLAAAVAAVLGMHAPIVYAADAKVDEGLGEIIVTAQKRAETVMAVPATVSALSGDTLERQGMTSFADYMALIPSLTNNTGGAPGSGQIILRGLNSGSAQLTATVGYYVDDAPVNGNGALSFANFATPDVDLGDVDHIEVLKGPQATLYGANTLGGLIKIVTNKPDLSGNSGSVRVEGSNVSGGDTGYSAFGVGNFVLNADSTLALRVSAFSRQTPGYMQNVQLGTKDLASTDSKGGRAALRWVPNDKLDATLSASLQNTDTKGWTYEFVDPVTLQPTFGRNKGSALFDSIQQNKYRIVSLNVNYQADAGTLTNSLSYSNYKGFQLQDWNDYIGPLNGFCFLAPTFSTPCGPGLPAGQGMTVNQSPDVSKFTEELRFATKRYGNWEGIGGLFFSRETTRVLMPLANYTIATMTVAPAPWGNVYDVDTRASYRETAAFANATYYFTDNFDLQVGGRYSKNKQTFNTCSSGWLTFVPTPYCQPNDLSDSNFSYLGALRWRITPDINTYVRIASAYRPGGPQSLPAPGETTKYKPDTLVNYEVGLKGEWLDHRLRTTVALYDEEWEDIQMNAQNTSNGTFSTVNPGKARVRGAELEVTVAPAHGLVIAGTLAYLTSELVSVDLNGARATGARKGDRLPYSPKWSGSLLVDYQQPIGGDRQINYGATYRYQGDRISGFPNADDNTGVTIPSYDTIDVRVGFEWAKRYELQARVSNLTDEHAYSTVVNWRLGSFQSSPSWASVIQPRTYSVGLSAKF